MTSNNELEALRLQLREKESEISRLIRINGKLREDLNQMKTIAQRATSLYENAKELRDKCMRVVSAFVVIDALDRKAKLPEEVYNRKMDVIVSEAEKLMRNNRAVFKAVIDAPTENS